MLSYAWGLQSTLSLPEAQGLRLWFALSLQPPRVLCGAELFSRPGPEDLFPLLRWKKDAGECCPLAPVGAGACFLPREIKAVSLLGLELEPL